MNPFRYWRMRVAHKRLHSNSLFYTLTPELTIALMKVFQGSTVPGAYYEFGIFKGYNLWFVNRLRPGMPIYGFDSFEGMPKSKGAHPHHAKGGYAAGVEEVRGHLDRHGADLNSIELCKGWFTKEHFDSLKSRNYLPASVVTIDCDLYSSCVPVLDFVYPLLQDGTIILFDDWKMEEPSEKTATREFLIKHPEIGLEGQFGFGIYGVVFKVKKGAGE